VLRGSSAKLQGRACYWHLGGRPQPGWSKIDARLAQDVHGQGPGPLHQQHKRIQQDLQAATTGSLYGTGWNSEASGERRGVAGWMLLQLLNGESAVVPAAEGDNKEPRGTPAFARGAVASG
jgi:hypothetical protein